MSTFDTWTLGIAAYAAGVSTVVALRQILTDLPHVVVRYHDARLVTHRPEGAVTEEVHSLTVVNGGRRPVQIDQVAYLASGFHIPGWWIETGEVPFWLREGERKSLYLKKEWFQDKPIPSNAVWVVRDTVGRWWPRSRRWRVKFETLRLAPQRWAARRGAPEGTEDRS